MAIEVSINSGKDYENLSEGVHPAVLADIIDLGVVDTQFGPKPKVRFRWLTSEVDSEGRTKSAFQTFTKSLHEKATLAKYVKSILGAAPTGAKFDLESLLGVQRRLVVEHSEGKNGETYSNVTAILKPEPSSPKIAVPSDFVRKQDKKAN